MNNISSGFGNPLTLLLFNTYSQRAIPSVAVAASVFFSLAPWKTISEIRESKSTLAYTFLPFYFMALQNYIFLLYAYTTTNNMLTFTTLLGLTLGLYYVAFYYKYAQDKNTLRVYMSAAVVISTALLYVAVSMSARESQLLIGIPGNFVMILTAASPLSELKNVVKKKDSSAFAFGMSLMNILAGGIWTLYGILLEDPLVVFPNIVTFVMGLIQVFYIYKYPPKQRGTMSSSKFSSKVSSAKVEGFHRKNDIVV